MLLNRPLFLLVLIVPLFLMAFAPMTQTEPPALDIAVLAQLAIAAFSALVGWPVLLSSLIAVLQYFNILSLDKTQAFNFWANAIVFGGIFIAALLGKISLVNVLDSTFGNIAQLLAYILILLGIPKGFTSTQKEHGRLREAAFFAKRLK